MIPALVLTAGLATRLRPLSLIRAKAALPVAGMPLVERIVRHLIAAGTSDLVLNLHHLAHTITTLMGDGSHLGGSIRYSWESPVLGSAGGPRRAAFVFDHPTFLIVNGDTLTSVDLRALAAAHHASTALVTMALVPNTEPHKYGGVQLDDRGWFTGFVPRGSAQPSFHFVGVQVANAQAFASVPDSEPSEVRALYPALVRSRPDAVQGFVTTTDFFDIGTPADYLHTCLRLAANDVTLLHGNRCRVDPGASLRETVLWDDVTVGAGARLERCIVTDGVTVPAGGTWNDVILRRAGYAADEEGRVGDLTITRI
jgi:mannose-1-phosphate guanylyltransferase